MRLLTVTHFYEAHGGGIERVAGRLNREFAALGHDTSWAASDEDGLPDAGTAAAVPLACWNLVERMTGLPMPIPGLAGLRRLRRAIRASDAVVVHDALYVSSIAAMLLARRARKPVLLIQHIADIPFSNPLLQRVMALANRVVTRPMLRAADRIVFISETTRRAFAAVKTREAPLLLFNGVDTGIFHAGESGARAELAIGPDEKLVLFVGRFVEKKGLAAIERLARMRPAWRFVLAGRGPIDPRRWGLANAIVAEGRSGETLAALYRAADLLLLPSVGEGYPLVVQEAMACGLPVICGAETAQADPGAEAWLHGVDVSLADPQGTATRALAAIEALDVGAAERTRMAAYAARAYDWRETAARIVSAIRRA